MMGYGAYGIMGGFSMIFVLIHLAAVIYFFYLLSSIANSLKHIATKIEAVHVDSTVAKPANEAK